MTDSLTRAVLIGLLACMTGMLGRPALGGGGGGAPPVTYEYCVHPYVAPTPEQNYPCERSSCATDPCPWGGLTISSVVGYQCKTTTVETTNCVVTGNSVHFPAPTVFTCDRHAHPQCPPGEFQCVWTDAGTGQPQSAIDCETVPAP